MTTIALTVLFSGLLILAICLPLIFRKVPMNHIYGIRLAAAFESEQRWYDLNEYGGKRLATWSLVIIASGVVGFFVPLEHRNLYAYGSAALVVLCVAIPALQIFRRSRKLEAGRVSR